MREVDSFTQTFELKIVTLDEFLALVPRETFDGRIYSYNDMFKVNEFTETDGMSEYMRRSVSMVRGSEKKIALSNILLQARHRVKWRVPIRELYEDISVEFAMKFGNPEYIVKLGSRRYMAADPQDFRVISGKQGLALVCFATGRLEVYELMPITFEEAEKIAKESYEASIPSILDELIEEETD